MKNSAENEDYPLEKYIEKTIIIDKKSFVDKNQFVLPKNHYQYIDKIVLSKGMILDRIEKLAQEITRDYFDKNVYLLVILKGAAMFGGFLAEKINDILSNDITNSYSMNFFVEYVDVKSYVDDKSTGEVKIRIDEKLKQTLKNQNVIIVEDINDSGQSLNTLTEYLKQLEPYTLKSVVLIQKMNKNHLKYNYEIDYIGFLIPDEFLIGFGMDYNDQFRQLNHLCTINQEGIERYKTQVNK
jgi:hypoxanthine phosphoribosyltransferase